MIQHTTVYRQPGRYAGWPANYGIWCWGDEIVVGFVTGSLARGAGFHICDGTRPFTTMQARSVDGGITWEAIPCPCPAPGGRAISADEHVLPERSAARAIADGLEPRISPCPGVDFTHPDFALLCARTGLEEGAVSWFYTSTDRCRTWQGPYALPDFGMPGVAARTDAIIDGANECLLFLTAAKRDGREGRVFCARSADGGRTFAFRAWVGEEPRGYAIMPASVRTQTGEIVTAVRRSEQTGCWIDLYRSADNGQSWQVGGRAVENTGRGGNPPALTRLRDGRLCLTYGFRDAPYGVRARLSEDGGRSWGAEIPLRADGGCHDLGYPRTVQRADGALVTIYYFNDHPQGERFIAATVWEP